MINPLFFVLYADSNIFISSKNLSKKGVIVNLRHLQCDKAKLSFSGLPLDDGIGNNDFLPLNSLIDGTY